MPSPSSTTRSTTSTTRTIHSRTTSSCPCSFNSMSVPGRLSRRERGARAQLCREARGREEPSCRGRRTRGRVAGSGTVVRRYAPHDCA
eukprot:6308214-Prymnesium_polylepis.1